MQKKYQEICKILNLPTHGIHITNAVDDHGIPVHMPYEMNDAHVLSNIIRVLDKELRMCKDRGIDTHIFKVWFAKNDEELRMRRVEGISEDKVRAEFECLGYSNIQIYKEEE